MHVKTYIPLTLGLLFLVNTALWAQVQTIRGVVQEDGTNETVPFVHLRITGKAYGTSTNLDGQFEIKLDLQVMRQQRLSLTLSCIGYHNLRIAAEDLQPTNTFVLKPNTTSLAGVTVTGKKPKKKLINQGRRIVALALRRIPANYHSKTVLYPSFYRHYCAENETYVRLIEAALDVYRSQSKPYRALYPAENLEFQVHQLRRSFDFTKSARLSHPPISLNFLLANDLTSYEYKNPFFNKRAITYALRDTTFLDEQKVAVVDFQAPSTAAHPESLDGTFYIGLNDYAFLKMDVHERFARGTISDSVDLHIVKTTFYKKLSDKYYLDRTFSDLEALHLTFGMDHEVTDSVVHRSHVELITNDVQLNPSKKVEGDEPKKEELRQIEYDSLFWKKYTILEATEVEKKIIADLSERLSLEKQFEMFNDIDLGGKSVIASDRFQNVLSKYNGTPTFVILWASWAYPNYFDIDPAPYLAKRIKREKADLVLVSLDDNDEEWEMSRMIYQLDRKGIEHERLDFEFDSEVTQKYFKNVLPYRCFFDAEGNLASTPPPLPSDPGIQDYWQTILQNYSAAETDTLSPPALQTQN